MSPWVDIRWPRRGLDENESYTLQPPETTREAKNVRTKDPVTGALRGAQRSGHTKYCPDQLDSAKVKQGCVVAHDVPNITFANKSSALDSDDIVDSEDTPSFGTSKRVFVDRIGDIYALDGRAGIVKWNSRFQEQWRINLPTEDESHEVRALYVDRLLNVYAATSLGNQPSKGRIWRYRPDLDDDIVLDWTWEPGGLVPDLVERNGFLYYVVNFPETGRSSIVSLTDLDRVTPRAVFVQDQAPYPANAITVNMDGALLTAHEPAIGRGKNPQAPDADPVQQSWTPRDLDNAEERIYSWHSADNIDGQGNAGLENDDPVQAWFDQTGNGRNYYFPINTSLAATNGGSPVLLEPPTYAEKAQAGRPGVRFNGTNNLLCSLPNPSTAYGSRDAQKTTVPAYEAARDETGATIANTGSAYLMVMAVRVDLDDGGLTSRFLWSHEGADDDTNQPAGGIEDRHIIVNKTAGALTANITSADQGRVFVHEQTDHTTVGAVGGHGGAGNYPASVNDSGDAGLDDGGGTPTYGDAIDNTSGVVILSYLCDGGFQAGTYDTSTTHSFVRLNGRPIDRYVSNPNYSLNPDYIGGTGIATIPAAGAGELNRFFRGWVLEKIVIQRTVDLAAATTEDIVVEHAKYGWSTTPVSGDTDWPGATVDQTDTEVAKLEGYLWHRWGKKSVAPGTTTEYGHPYRSDVPLAPSQPATFNVNNLRSSSGILAKWSGDSGLPIWSVQGANLGQGGIGYDVRVAPTGGQIYSYGPANGAAVFVRRIDDTGDQPTITGGDTWLASLGMTQTNLTFTDTLPRMAVDVKDNVYVPVGVTPASGNDPSGDVVVLDQDGTVIHNFNRDATNQWYTFGCAVPPEPLPPYPDSLTGQRSPFFYAAGDGEDQGATDVDNVVRVSQITETVNANPSRVITTVAVVGDTLYKVTDSAASTPTGASGALDATARYVDMVAAYEKVYITDGLGYYVYDPRADELTEWVAEHGELPPRCRINALWRGRVILSAGDDPHEVYASAQGDPLDWNRQPAVPLATQAFRISDTRLGAVPDIVRALIPATEETLLMGCDHSIHAITGEPLLEGRPQVVSDKVGIAWNSSWTKDREGRIYFFESQGGIWVLQLGGGAQRISRDRIERRLRNIDLSTYYVHLEWDYEDEGLRVCLFPWGAPGALVERYFWEQQTDAWWPDTSSDLNKQPTAMWALDGDDPGDRVLLVGSGDGYVLKQDRTAADDDGTAIHAQCDIGPFGALDANRETRFNRFAVTLSDSQGGARSQMFSSNEPDVKGGIKADKMLFPGRNGPFYQRVAAAHLWLRIANHKQGERFAFEHAGINATLAGRIKPKARERT